MNKDHPEPSSTTTMSISLSPPFEGVFSSYEELFSSTQSHAKANGYAIAIGNSRATQAYATHHAMQRSSQQE